MLVESEHVRGEPLEERIMDLEGIVSKRMASGAWAAELVRCGKQGTI
jgi:hypothetical protein